MAEQLSSITIQRSKALFEEAKTIIPGGVNSPVRAFRSVGGDPLFIKRAQGAFMWDVDDNRYLDLINSWGPMILGHAQADIVRAAQEALALSSSFGAPSGAEVQMARLVTDMMPSVEKVRMVNSGTEATMSAIRLARGYTGRDKIIKFAGCYHGHGDSFLIAAGSGAMTFGVPDSQGVTEGVAQDTLTARFNDLESVKELISANPGQIAALILEPVAGNMGVIPPQSGFLEGLRSLCDKEGIVLIFDEVMTGFRLSQGGAQERFGVRPDISTLGKIIGGGMPVGAYGGKAEIMDFVSPDGPVYQAGTLSGNPVAMAAGIAMLSRLSADKEIYTGLEHRGEEIAGGLRDICRAAGVKVVVNQVGSMFTLFFHEGPVRNYDEAKACDTDLFARFFKNMLGQGIYLPPSQFEAAFLSSCVGDAEVDQFLSAARKSIRAL